MSEGQLYSDSRQMLSQSCQPSVNDGANLQPTKSQLKTSWQLITRTQTTGVSLKSVTGKDILMHFKTEESEHILMPM